MTMRRALIEEQNRYLLERQRQFRRAADVVTDAWTPFPEICAIAVIGSVAKPLWKEVPRFREFRREGIEVWHECGDLDLALWVSSQHRLGQLRRVATRALREAYEAGASMSVASHQLDVFLFEPGTDRYLGRLCSFNECPKAKRDCLAPGCGATRRSVRPLWCCQQSRRISGTQVVRIDNVHTRSHVCDMVRTQVTAGKIAHKAAEQAQRTDAKGSINLRIEAQTRQLIDDAAAVLGKTRTEFMIDSARAQAIDVLLDQRLFVLEPERYEAFMHALDNPPAPGPKLRALLRRKPSWST